MEEIYFCGYEVGVLVMKSWVPKPPGHISCASNYDFPVYYFPVDHTDNKKVHAGSIELIPALTEAAASLKRMGCRVLLTSCGYFGHYQRILADTDMMPVYLSAVCLAPMIFRLMGKKKSLVLICYNKKKLTEHLLEACGVSKSLTSRIHIYDVIQKPELGKIITDCGEYDITKAREEVVSVARDAVKEHPDAGAVLLECTDLPPHAFAIQAALNLPVFDAVSMLKFVQTLISEKITEVKNNENIDHNSSWDGNKVQKITRGGGRQKV